ncbi:MAG: hypothetical protein PHR11_04870, partial [Candidatus Omnitrophica bacterium]|nr:hypothetical protein [Candidatus Omnitrophota bacterium]
MKTKISVYLGCIAIAAAAAYALSLRNGFVWDDVLLIVHNDFIKGWKLLPQVFSKPLFYIANPAYQYYRPLQTFTYIFDYSLWGLAPAGFHLSNVLLHICVALLSFALVHSFSANARLAFWSSLLFAVHPVNTTVVCYVSSRADILLALFSACSLLLFLHARAWQLHVLSLAFFAAALLSKETALILPLCLVLAGETRLCLGTGAALLPPAQRRRRYAAYFLVALVYLFLRKSVVEVSTRILPQSYPGIGSLFATLVTAAASYAKFIFFPSGIHMLHTVPVAPGPGAFFPVLPVLLAAIAALVALYRVQKFLFLWAGMFFLWMAPAISLAFRNPEYYNQGLAMAQVHWLYAALLGICVIFVFGIEKAGRLIGGRTATAVLGLCAVLLSGVSVAENLYWKDNLTFFTHTAGYVRKSATVFRNLGWIYLNRNDADKALEAYNYALGLQKDAKAKAIAYKDLSNAYVYAGMPLEARNAALESVRLDPLFADGYAQLGKTDAQAHPGSGRDSWL